MLRLSPLRREIFLSLKGFVFDGVITSSKDMYVCFIDGRCGEVRVRGCFYQRFMNDRINK